MGDNVTSMTLHQGTPSEYYTVVKISIIIRAADCRM